MKVISMIFVIVAFLVSTVSANEINLRTPNIYKYPYLIKKYGIRKAKRIIKDKEYRLEHISNHDLKLLRKTYKIGQRNDLGYSLTAILWQESDIGHKLHNFADPSCGYYHKLLPELCRETHLKPNMWNMSRACDKLMSYNFSTEVAVADLLRRRQIFKMEGYPKYEIWRKMIRSYNGSNFNSLVYLDFIRLDIYLLKQINLSNREYKKDFNYHGNNVIN